MSVAGSQGIFQAKMPDLMSVFGVNVLDECKLADWTEKAYALSP